MAAYGCSSTVFALLLSRVSKYAGRYLLFAVAGAVNLVTLIAMYIWKPTSDQMALIYVVPIVWGLAEGIWQTQSNGMFHFNSCHLFCALWYSDNIRHIISIVDMVLNDRNCVDLVETQPQS